MAIIILVGSYLSIVLPVRLDIIIHLFFLRLRNNLFLIHIIGIRLMVKNCQYMYAYVFICPAFLYVISWFLLVCRSGQFDNRMFLLMFSWFDVCRCFSWLNVFFLILWALSKLSVFG